MGDESVVWRLVLKSDWRCVLKWYDNSEMVGVEVWVWNVAMDLGVGLNRVLIGKM